ncbi:hypothetical protein TRIATDRAFT_242742 [Trichoderma atroviride IMI 206040]|uniref:Zn(2)-C6 fungal-type domain-containing protein n=1 Tax=Hypocrea atroviridis (strain ATCC 20476 / IMI 206040) TaxID=452589 RepID=G9NV63_HYPAI|nr:uncharacterized protein TRIATDRAFT_242742 [Trichoderma atroviride IMI 206040]EHK44884.1 hypothetical protein TRIATDRAFT_242742 [Trichoderma atroviride IMI 206040]
MAPPSGQRHVCHCGRGFLRKEHLRRHQAIHSSPSFTCHVCSRSFSRSSSVVSRPKGRRLKVRKPGRYSDLLRRHLTLHDGPAHSDSKRVRACDACHASKIRCDGGTRCSLCTKRGIDCAFTRGPGPNGTSDLQRRSVSSLPSTSKSHSPDTPTPSIPTSDADGTVKTVTSLSTSYTDIVGPADQATQHLNPSIATAGLKLILNVISNPLSSETMSRNRLQLPEEIEKWSSECLRAYITNFHDRWPILHIPTFEREVISIGLRSTAIMIGSWVRNETADNSLVYDIHSILVKNLLADLNDTLMKKGRLLYSLLVTVFRQLKVFNAEAVEHQIRIHFSGDFPPWAFAMKEKWKRLTTNLFKLDTYISLLTQQPPSVQREEMSLGLTSTFALWNAYGLDVFFRRWPSEPLERSSYKICDLALGSQQPISPVMLVEDIQIRMMGVTNYVWILSKMRGNPNPALCASADQKELIATRLKRCKLQLDGMAALWMDPEQHKMHIEFLLRAYMGSEEPFHNDWEKYSRGRFFSYVFSATMMYHLLSMHIYADAQSYMQNLPGITSSLAPCGITLPNPPNTAEIKEWAMSMDSRIAVSHAIVAYRVYSGHVSPSELKAEVVDPIAHMTIAVGAGILWTWIQNNGMTCTCDCMNVPLVDGLDFGFVRLETGKSPEVESWIRTGGDVWLNGVQVCKCNVGVWLSPFAAILAHGARKWEIGNAFAQKLWNQLGLQRSV